MNEKLKTFWYLFYCSDELRNKVVDIIPRRVTLYDGFSELLYFYKDKKLKEFAAIFEDKEFLKFIYKATDGHKLRQCDMRAIRAPFQGTRKRDKVRDDITRMARKLSAKFDRKILANQVVLAMLWAATKDNYEFRRLHDPAQVR